MLEPLRHPYESLAGSVIHSEAQPGVRYALERTVGEGGMGFAYLARRESPSGSAPVVVKVMRPELWQSEVNPALVAMKEAVALGRLNEQVPPTPFVVRFVDSGMAELFGREATPWTAIEYVHGGVEGTSLEERVTYSLHKTGYGFHIARAAHAIRCLVGGLSAIHAVNVVHRDLSPANVLCCGFGTSEIFKISDFGVARPGGIDKSFVGVSLGTVGYSAPEASYPAAGPQSDVFSLACVVFYLLTGQRYFEVDSPAEAFRAYTSARRQGIGDHPSLHPELSARPELCRSIDRELARATEVSSERRQASAREFGASVLATLGATSFPLSNRALVSAVVSTQRSPEPAYRFDVQSQPGNAFVATSVAWDPDGHALALTTQGLRFWNGERFLDASTLVAPWPASVDFVSRHDGGGWLLGGAGPALLIVHAAGATSTLPAPRAGARLTAASGHVDDLLCVVDQAPGQTPLLACASRRRWLKPLPLLGVAVVTVLLRLDETRWLVGGRRHPSAGFAAIYSPLDAALDVLALPEFRALVGGASTPERTAALLAGSDGVVLCVDPRGHSVSRAPEHPDLAAAGLDILGQEWVGGRGRLWQRSARSQGSFDLAWHDPRWAAPFISILADAGSVLAMTADGGIVQGRRPTSVGHRDL
jgi:serine/threonine protein kinase